MIHMTGHKVSSLHVTRDVVILESATLLRLIENNRHTKQGRVITVLLHVSITTAAPNWTIFSCYAHAILIGITGIFIVVLKGEIILIVHFTQQQ